MKYKMKKFTTEETTKILKDLVGNLSGIDPSDLTEFEQRVLSKLTSNPPKFRRVRNVLIEHYDGDPYDS